MPYKLCVVKQNRHDPSVFKEKGGSFPVNVGLRAILSI